MKKNIFKISALLTLALTACLLACGCVSGNSGDGQTDSSSEGDTQMNIEGNAVFANGEYKFGFIYPALGDTEVTALRNKLSRAFKEKTGIMPPFKKDDAVEDNAETFEVIFGETTREAGVAPEGVNTDTDAYYCVRFVGKKLIISGSDNYQLGLAVDYFIDNFLKGDKVDTLVIPEDVNKCEVLKDYTRPYWGLPTIPAYPEGQNNMVQPNVYNCGTTISEYASAGRTEDSSLLQMITKSTESEFTAYVSKLESFGFTQEYQKSVEENLYVGLFDGNQRVYLTFNGFNGKVKVVVDPSGMSLDEFGYSYTPKAGERSEYYLYSIPMSDGKSVENGGNGKDISGMLMVIKCADNSVIVVDGGAETQMNDASLAGLDTFLKEITNTPEGQKVRISAWYMTHYHGDHIQGFLKFLKKYGDDYSLERVMGNLPTDDAVKFVDLKWSVEAIKSWNVLLSSKYPDCKEIKIHTGQEIQIADVKFLVLYTHEDNLTNGAVFNSTDSNDTSSVVRVDNGLMSMIITGDANTRSQSVINAAFSAVTLKCDIFQAAHHMMYPLEMLENRAAPTIMYIPQSLESANKNGALWEGATYTWSGIRDSYYNLVGKENCYFAGNETVGYAVVDGKLTKIYHSTTVPGRYD